MAAVAVDELGPNCCKNGITSPMLLSYVSTESCVRLPEVPTITNELILELSRFKDRHSQCTFKTLHEWIRALHGSMWPQEEPPTYQAISKSIERLTAWVSLKNNTVLRRKMKSSQNFFNKSMFCQSLDFIKAEYYTSVQQRSQLVPKNQWMTQTFKFKNLSKKCTQ